MTIDLNKDIKKDILNGKLKAFKLINYLIKKGFKTSKQASKTSLLDLTFNDQKIKKAYLQNFELIIKF